MYVVFNYVATVVIWGSTWYVIRFQLDGAAHEVSIALRFLLASAALFTWSYLARRRLRIARRQYPWVALQGVLLFCANYMMVYFATQYVTSGLIAVLFTLLIPFNLVHERLFFKKPVSVDLIIAAALGVGGITLVFWPEFYGTELNRNSVLGIGACCLGAWIASLGNMAAIRNTREKLPVMAINAHGMLWGGAASLLLAAFLGRSFHVDWTPGYTWSLLYLALLGSAVAFGCYLSLINRIGAGKAAYTSVLFPIVALMISTLFEAYRWSTPAFLGIALAVAGNALLIGRKNREAIPRV